MLIELPPATCCDKLVLIENGNFCRIKSRDEVEFPFESQLPIVKNWQVSESNQRGTPIQRDEIIQECRLCPDLDDRSVSDLKQSNYSGRKKCA